MDDRSRLVTRLRELDASAPVFPEQPIDTLRAWVAEYERDDDRAALLARLIAIGGESERVACAGFEMWRLRLRMALAEKALLLRVGETPQSGLRIGRR